ncbi:YsnF/AvaK domain-containing protein [Tychonema sp. BBK16]|uniref:YsnF/AvaK domain-containing protein n=1 Tax=Tychonema sp. BBK16 TaxID=2699888 RepID=UPI001F2ABD80|nr:DUF2382 domain-containing protein [Tychonema sp. BBK16]MCF6372852.1 DUF2382 domain-containing protein [Tychonema sp. BBK16]
MNSQASATKIEAAQSNTSLNQVPEKVRTKLKSFIVKDRDGELVGKVKDVYLNASNQLNFVVTGNNNEKPRLFLLNIKLIKKVDYHEKFLFAKLSLEQIEMLPEKSVNGKEEHLEVAPVFPSDMNHSHQIRPQPVMSNQTDTEIQIENLEIGENHEDLDIVDQEVIRLLEERLVINRSKRKVGEVIVRKEIETRMVQVPIQREKLIVEQVGDDPKVLAEIDLGEGQITGIDLNAIKVEPSEPTVIAEFASVQKASKMLNLIASQPRHGCVKVRLEIVLENYELQETYQKWIDSL